MSRTASFPIGRTVAWLAGAAMMLLLPLIGGARTRAWAGPACAVASDRGIGGTATG